MGRDYGLLRFVFEKKNMLFRYRMLHEGGGFRKSSFATITLHTGCSSQPSSDKAEIRNATFTINTLGFVPDLEDS